MRRWLRKVPAGKRGVIGMAAVLIGLAALMAPLQAQALPIPPSYGGFPVILDPSLPSGGQTIPLYGFLRGGPTVIKINPNQWRAVPDALQQYTLDHELGHATLNHAAVIRAYGGNVPPQVLYQMEWDADTFAARAMTKRGQGAWVEETAQFYLRLEAQGSRALPLHPPYPLLAQHLRAVMMATLKGH